MRDRHDTIVGAGVVLELVLAVLCAALGEVIAGVALLAGGAIAGLFATLAGPRPPERPERFAGLELAELQQTYGALQHARGLYGDGPGDLIARLAGECGRALDAAIVRDTPPRSSDHAEA